jgi:hypothetical protein
MNWEEEKEEEGIEEAPRTRGERGEREGRGERW